MPEVIDLVGRKFDRLTVIRKFNCKKPRAWWLCACECGGEVVASSDHLTTSHVRSCGCLQMEAIRRKNRARDRDRNKKSWIPSAEYQAWRNMRQRCGNPNNRAYKDYGGRGITVCDRWQGSFKNFLSDMGRKPTPKHSLDRIDVNGNYTPDNCRWATKSVQSRNTRQTVFIEHDGERLCLIDWAERFGINYITLIGRIKRGMSFRDAISAPVGSIGRWSKSPHVRPSR